LDDIEIFLLIFFFDGSSVMGIWILWSIMDQSTLFDMFGENSQPRATGMVLTSLNINKTLFDNSIFQTLIEWWCWKIILYFWCFIRCFDGWSVIIVFLIYFMHSWIEWKKWRWWIYLMYCYRSVKQYYFLYKNELIFRGLWTAEQCLIFYVLGFLLDPMSLAVQQGIRFRQRQIY
jgi:hypothetical protein